MNTETLNIRTIRSAELPLIRNFPPKEWTLDLEAVYRRHYDREYFYPVVAIVDGDIAGTGIAFINDAAAWLGTIIVNETHRNQGIGKAITEHLIEHAKTRGARTILLTASELGLPIYIKIGFQHDLDYVFLKSESPKAIDSVSPYIQAITDADVDAIIGLDRAVTGERRDGMLLDCAITGFAFREDRLKGFYLPDFGKGLIVADTDTAGIALLNFRFSRDASPICVPETNTAAITLCTSLGYAEYKRSPRMFLYTNVLWSSEKIFSRGAGYFG